MANAQEKESPEALVSKFEITRLLKQGNYTYTSPPPTPPSTANKATKQTKTTAASPSSAQSTTSKAS